MIEHVERFPRRPRPVDLRRRSRRTSSRAASAPGCPAIREWTERHYELRRLHHRLRPGRPRRPRRAAGGARLRRRAASASSSVGGSGVGGELLRRVIEALPRGRERVPEPADDRRRRPAHRPGRSSARRRGPRGARLRPRPAPAPRRLRRRRRAGRADHDDGADRGATAVRLPAAPATSSSASTCATASTATAPPAWMDYDDATPAAARRRDRGRIATPLPPTGRSSPAGRAGRRP